MDRLEPPAPVSPEGAVDHRIRVEPDAVGLEQRDPPERLLDRIAAHPRIAHVEVGQDAGEPAVGHPPSVGLAGVRIGQRVEPEVAHRRAVDRPVEPVIGRRVGDPAVLRPGVAEDVVLDHLQAEPVGLVHQRAILGHDVILSLGARFEEMETNWRAGFVPSPAARVIQVDIDAAEIGRSVPAHLAVIGDIRSVLEAMIEVIRRASPAGGAGVRPDGAAKGYAAEIKTIEADIAELAASQEIPIHPLRVIRAVRQALPREATVAIDVGCLAQHMAGSFPAFPVHLPRSLIVPSSFYGMGFAGSALPVARQVYPDRPAVGFIGDGSFQMMLHVLPMAAEYRLGVTWCILNDRALGSIRDIQEFGMGNRIIDTDFKVQPDFAKIAQACECHGEQITDPAGVDAAIARALAANERGIPAVLDFIVARARMQQTYEHYAFYGRG